MAPTYLQIADELAHRIARRRPGAAVESERRTTGHRVGATAVEVGRRTRLLDRVDERRRAVAALAPDAGLVLASHDDDTAESPGVAGEVGARICEFPVTLVAAERGLGIVMGAPNARRGRSQHDNLSVRDALRRGLLTARWPPTTTRPPCSAARTSSPPTWSRRAAGRPAVGDAGLACGRVGPRADAGRWRYCLSRS